MSYTVEETYDLKKIVHDKDYAKSLHLIVKPFGKVYIIKYDKTYLNINNIQSLGLFRSLILDDNGNIICFSPPKSYNLLLDDTLKNKNFSDYEIQEYLEGTMINLFWHPFLKDWELSTKSNVGAKNYFNDNKNTFRYMFLQACNNNNLNFDDLDKNYSYSFVLQHPDNRIVIPFSKIQLYLVNVYRFEKNKIHNVEFNKLDIFKKANISSYMIFNKNTLNIHSFENLYDHVLNDNLDYKIVGYICYNRNTGERIKIRNNNYEIVRRLKGNTPKLQFQYYYLRQLDKVKEYLKYYPEHSGDFLRFRYDLHQWTNKLYGYYISCFIKKEKSLKEYPYEFKPHLYALHNKYLNELMIDKKFVSKSVVIKYVNTLPPQRLMYSINYQLQLNNIDEKKMNLEN
tara:strand:- start:2750 stop:3943 length:1194 start_codon:yes stop_codon:yes gene_type:complete